MRSAALAASAASILLLLPLGYTAPSPAPALGPAEEPTVRYTTRDVDAVSASTARSAIDTMNNFYNRTDGRWSSHESWWVTGNALQAVLDFMYKTGSNEYMPYAQYTFQQQRAPVPWWPQGGGEFRADSSDDTGWWALAMLRFYDITRDRTFLEVAMEDEAYMYQYWSDNVCGGGIIWSIRTQTYKNAISNELYMALTAALHRRTGDAEYLRKSVRTWQWFKNSGMINAQHLINDGLAESHGGRVCTNNGQQVWTYNQGVILGALVDLHKATGDNNYLHEAKLIANAVVHSRTLSPGGILTESCEAARSCDDNSNMFKGIFARNLGWLDDALPDHPYRSYLANNIKSMRAKDRSSNNYYDVYWKGPFLGADIATQASAVSLLVAAI